MSACVAVLATLDTKAGEARFLHDAITRLGREPRVVDTGLSDEHGAPADVDARTVAAAAGTDLAQLRGQGRRDAAMEAMGRGAGRVLRDWFEAGELGGVVAVGGNQGSAIAAIAMQQLPVGVPKLIVSTVASGNVRSYVGDADIAMLFSVGDLLGGPNAVTRRVLAKAAGAVVGMVAAEEADAAGPPGPSRGIAVTAFGNTHRAVIAVMDRLSAAGRHVIPFHASGACGSAMERLVEEGAIEAVVDLTTHELLGELYPEDVYAPVRPGRLTAAGRSGIPQVVAPGGLEYFCFGAPDTIPAGLRGRPTHHHNPYNTNVRTDGAELERVATLMAERLNAATGPVAVMIPLRGWSEVGSPGGVLHDPDANAAFVGALRARLDPRIALRELDTTINDAAFATAAADLLLQLEADLAHAP